MNDLILHSFFAQSLDNSGITVRAGTTVNTRPLLKCQKVAVLFRFNFLTYANRPTPFRRIGGTG